MKSKYEEIKGDNQNESMEQLEMCKYLVQGIDKPCKHRDMYGRCTFENCILDEEESPLRSKKWCSNVLSVSILLLLNQML